MAAKVRVAPPKLKPAPPPDFVLVFCSTPHTLRTAFVAKIRGKDVFETTTHLFSRCGVD